jgi:hypothetical protein
MHIASCCHIHWLIDKQHSVQSTTDLPSLTNRTGRAIAEAVNRWLPTAAARVRARSGQVGFVVDKVAPGEVFSEYFGFTCQVLHNHHHLSSGAGTQSSSGRSTQSPTAQIKKKIMLRFI